jgi:hypothetical protein
VDAAGAPAFGIVSGVLLGLIVLALTAGWVQGAVLKRSRPAVYATLTEAISE